MSKARLITLIVVSVIALVLIFQNIQSVQTRLLFATIEMPQALLLIIVFALGFTGGLVTRYLVARPAAEGEKKPAG